MTSAVLRNVVKAWALMAGIAALLGLAGYAVGGVRLGASVAGMAALLELGTLWVSDRLVMGFLRARELPVSEDAAFHASVDRMASRLGVPKPRVFVVPQGPPLGLVAGRGAAGAALGVTRSLVELPMRAEVEAVIAHELAHLRRRDVLPQTVAVLASAACLEVTRLGGFFERALVYVLAPVGSAFAHVLLSPRRELAADALAVRACGSAEVVSAALTRLDQATELIDFAASPAVEPLLTVNPFLEEGLARLFVTHPPLEQRLAALDSLRK